VAWQWHFWVRKKNSSMGHVNFLLCPSAIQFTDYLQPTAQKMPQAPHRGKTPSERTPSKSNWGKKSGKPD